MKAICVAGSGLPFCPGCVGGAKDAVACLNGHQPLTIDPAYLTFERRRA